ncbi:MAG: hypothetical protein IKN96_04155 [Oscillibacter sp.]|nr:hypothetical protein [Oscillibacter sp.]
MKDEYRELLCFLCVRKYSTERLEKILGQTDRNIRKKLSRLLARLRKKLFRRLAEHRNSGGTLTKRQREFMDAYRAGHILRKRRRGKIKRLFEHSSFYWVRYDRYELRRDANSLLYIMSAANATPEIYNPLKVAEPITLDALKVGMKCMNRQPTVRKQEAVMGFVNKYGLLGLMTALPTTPHFIYTQNHVITKSAGNPWINGISRAWH